MAFKKCLHGKGGNSSTDMMQRSDIIYENLQESMQSSFNNEKSAQKPAASTQKKMVCSVENSPKEVKSYYHHKPKGLSQS